MASKDLPPAAAVGAGLDVDGEPLAGLGGAEGVGLVHPHQRRDVQRLVELVAQHRALALAAGEDVGVALSPGDVLDIGDHSFHPLAGAVEAVVEADRVEGVAEVAQAGEQADRAGGARAGLGLDRVAGALVQRPRRVAHEVGAAEAGRGAAAGRPERVGVEHARQLARSRYMRKKR